MGDDILFVFVFAIVQLSAAEFVEYVRLMTLDDSLSLNLNWCHHPLITQLIFIIFILPILKRWSVLII